MMRTRPGAVGAAEEEYIAREEADRQRDHHYLQEQQRQRTARVDEAARLVAEERDKQAAAMRCPRCTTPLHGETLRGAPIDRCASCGGAWVGREQVEQFAGGTFLHRLAALFRSGSAAA